MELDKALSKLQILITDKSKQNLEIIKSHSLEILLSFSSTPDFLRTIPKYKSMIQVLIQSINSPRLKNKILLLLVNLSGEKELANILLDFGTVKAMFRILFETMRKVGFEHLQITKSLLEPCNESETKQIEENADSKVEQKIFQISGDNIPQSQKQKMLEMDQIKFSIMVLMNISLLSNKGRVQILEIDNSDLMDDPPKIDMSTEQTLEVAIQAPNTEESKFRNLEIVCDWVSHPRVGPLFENFIFVLVNLTSDPKLREMLVKHSMSHFERIFDNLEKRGDFEPILNLSSVLRNLSFSFEASELTASFNSKKFIPRLAQFLAKKELTDKQQNLIQLRIVDLFWVFHTNIDFAERKDLELQNFRFQGDTEDLANWEREKVLGKLGRETHFCNDIQVKLEALAQMFANFSS